jgi:outer membrane protein insertion porin family
LHHKIVKRFIYHEHISKFLRLCGLFLFAVISTFAQQKYENLPISDIQIAFEGADRDVSAAEQFKLILKPIIGEKYSAVKIREALQTLYDSDKIVSAKVEKFDSDPSKLGLRFVIKRKTNAEKVSIKIGETVGEPVTEAELLLKLNILNAGETVTDQILKNKADAIQGYLRERGFYSAEVVFKQQVTGNDTRVAVTFNVKPNTQSRVENFEINIKDFDLKKLKKPLKLTKGALFSQKLLDDDVAKIRTAIIKQNNLAPVIDSPKVIFDPETNRVSIGLKGEIGAKINVKIEAEKEKISEKDLVKLLPIKREGTIDYSAITEGGRRLRNRFQEKGYFFADVIPVCTVTPELPKDETNPVENGSQSLCQELSGSDLSNKIVDVNYQVELNRRLRLADLRIEGTDKLTILDIASVLDTQAATSLGIIPQFGYGRGYTSTEILEDDRKLVESLMKELGFRDARAKVKQGVSPEGEKLIITFVIKEGIPTKINDVQIIGSKEFSEVTLQNELPNLLGKNFSRARMRNGVENLRRWYAQKGYYDAVVNASTVELGKDEATSEDRVKIIYNVEKEGKKVVVNRILLNGNNRTKPEAIFKALALKPNEVLRQNDISQSEQTLYSTDAFKQIEIKAEPAGENAAGESQRDIVVNLEEEKPRTILYGGGYSTDLGLSGFFDIRYSNLFNRLQQGGARVRWSSRQQLIQVDFLDPRFLRDGKNRFAPLSISVQYQRDSTVTRFFRSTIDRGALGIVQRLDATGKPIDDFGRVAGDPTINRFSVTAETQRTISKKSRSLAFFRFRFEDVRLFNFESLLIKDLLRPDARVRISGFGANFVRDTRASCSRKYSVLELIAKGEIGDPCRYNASDPTKGSYLTLEYNTSLEQLGGNISFQKFQANYKTFYEYRNTVFAGSLTFGAANVWGKRRNLSGTSIQQSLNGTLPISERFFSGGSNGLRGFDFESAGPRITFQPQGNFFNTSGQQVFLNPFTVPFGGNALAIAQIEARIPLTKSIQAVPFYDGGNVFKRPGDIFRKPQVAANDFFNANLRAIWTNTVGLGARIKLPFGTFAVDYGYLLNPPRFFIPQAVGQPAIYRLKQGQLHFRFTQAF